MASVAEPPIGLGRGGLAPEIADLATRLGVEMVCSATTVRLSQTGHMREDPTSAWMTFRAEQTIAIDHCGFEWRASTGPGGLVHVRDALVHGQGDLKVTALGIVPIAHLGRSPDLTRGELMRYLAELAFAPDAIAFNTQLRWQVVSARVLRVEAGDGDGVACVDLTLDAEGQITEVYATARPRAVVAGFAPTPWRGRFSDYHHHHGRWLPFSAEVAWVLDGREFVYWQGRVESWEMESET